MRRIEVEDTIVEYKVFACLQVMVSDGRVSIETIDFLVRCTGDETDFYAVQLFCHHRTGKKKEAHREPECPEKESKLFHGAKLLKS
jgi:hypothetical protein